MARAQFQGTGTALVTPFLEDGSIDWPALERLVEFQIEAGIQMLLPCGTTGEGATLETDEWESVTARIVRAVDGRVPVIVGGGSNSTRQAVRLAKRAGELGADGVLSVGPYYNKPNQTGFYEHFAAVAREADVRLVVYNVPSRTGSNIRAETTLRLAEIPGIVAIKEASGDLDQVGEILRHRPSGFSVLSGDDALTLPMIALGADGVVSVVSNEAPKMFGQMVAMAREGDFQAARQIHYRLLPLMRANMSDTNPIPVKAIMSMMGLIQEHYRLPLVPVTDPARDKLRVIAAELGLLSGNEAKG